MIYLITGAAGFIGYHLSKSLLETDSLVIGVDNINSYYDPNLKYARLKELGIKKSSAEMWNTQCKSDSYKNFFFIRMNLEDEAHLNSIFDEFKPDIVINLAAQAGVRYSIENPSVYIQSNIVGFANILEACRQFKIKHLLYASSSSVYGNSKNISFSIDERVDSPISLYAATKKSNELMAYTYSHLYKLPTTGLRFFTVYGPWGRPDMAYFIFTEKILKGESIKVFNKGNMSRDFTYIDDIIDGILLLIQQDNKKNNTYYQLANIGKGSPQQLMKFISIIESETGIKANLDLLPMQPGDVPRTSADISELQKLGYKSKYSIEIGMKQFISWYIDYNKNQYE